MKKLRPVEVMIGVVVLIVAVLLALHVALGRDLDGRHANSPLKGWFDSLKSGKGPCCSDADGWALADVDWETNNGKYRVRVPAQQWLPSKEQPAPPGPNRDGRTLVWPIKGYGGLTIRCFMPGAMT